MSDSPESSDLFPPPTFIQSSIIIIIVDYETDDVCRIIQQFLYLLISMNQDELRRGRSKLEKLTAAD